MSTKRIILTINDPEVPAILSRLQSKTDFKSLRIKQLLALPDLTQTDNSPIKFLIDAIANLSRFNDFDIVNVPEVVSVKNNFDLLNAAPDHPSRRETDTYYLEKDYVLRTQTTVMWPYYFSEENIKNWKPKAKLALYVSAKFIGKTKLIVLIIRFSTK